MGQEALVDVTRGPRVPKDASSQGCLPAWVIPSLLTTGKSQHFILFLRNSYILSFRLLSTYYISLWILGYRMQIQPSHGEGALAW